MELDDDFVAIDADRLDQECLRQPRLVLAAGTLEADARLAVDELKRKFDLLEADLFLRVRNAPSEYDLHDKPTVDTIKSAVVVQPAYQDAVRKLNEAQHARAIHGTAVSALEHKKRMLEKSIDLLGMDYHSEPKPKSQSQERLNQRTKDEVRHGKKNVK